MIFIFEQAQKSRWPGYQQSKKKYRTFVENRVQEIRETTDVSKWFYCNTKKKSC